jgi:hypothetical protein
LLTSNSCRPKIYALDSGSKSTFRLYALSSLLFSTTVTWVLVFEPLEMATLLQLVLLLIWTCLSTTPEKRKHPIFTKVLSSQDVLGQLLSSTSPSFALGLFEVLQASTPPAVSYFKSLPTESKKRWAIYLLVLEKLGSRPRIYVGSATTARAGARLRLNTYDQGTLLLRYVEKALKEGYTIVHKGCLCWSPLPGAGEVPQIRVLFIALEAAFTFVFWAINCNTDYGFGMLDICQWEIEALDYDGLCSHNPLSEAPAGDHNLSAEELEAQAAERVRRLNEKSKRWADAHPKERAETYKRSKTKARDKQRHHCAICDMDFVDSSKLKRHEATKLHAN